MQNKLRKSERRSFKEYFLKSPAHQEKLGFALALKKRKTELSRKAKLYKFYLPASAAALIIIGFGIVTWRGFIYQSDVDKGLIALRAAFSKQRPVVARISALNYAPVPQQRGAEEVDTTQRSLAQGLLSYAAAHGESAEAYHALGQYYLADRQFDRAIAQFKMALTLEQRNARIHSDLGAALLEKGTLSRSEARQDEGGANEFAESLEHLNEALKLDPSLLSALFNRALLNQQMGLIPEAEKDWNDYIRQETDAGWAEEAKRRRSELEAEKKKTSRSKEEILDEFQSAQKSGDEESAWKLLSGHHNRPGNLVIEQLLDAFLEQSASGRKADAENSAFLLRYASELENRRSGDRLFSDLVHLYTSATPERKAILARARQAMGEGHESWGLRKFGDSFNLFSRAKQLFEQGGAVGEVKVAEYWMSFARYHDNKSAESLAILLPLTMFCEANGYVWLHARCLYLQSAIHFLANEHSKALNTALKSAELTERTNDSVGLLNAVSALVEYYRYLGNYRKMLGYIQRSLPLIRSIPLDPVQGARHYGFMASGFATIGRNDAAAAYQREALRFALNTGSDIAVANSYAYLGMINGRLKNFDEALRNVGSAFEIAQSHSGEGGYNSNLAYVSLHMAHIQRAAGQFDAAVKNYNRAIEIYEGFEKFSTHLYHAHKGRLLCFIEQRNDALAAEEITKTLALVERYRKSIHEENNRNTFFDVEQSVYDTAIDFTYSRQQNRERAFEYLEYSRSRSLLDLLQSDKEVLVKLRDPDILFSSVAQPLTLENIKRRMPEQAQILQYTVLEDKIFIWVISKYDLQIVVKDVSQKDLTDKVTSYMQIVSSPSEVDADDVLRNAKDLFSILIGPVESLLDTNKYLCIIPDKILNRVPFTTLVSPSSGQYLFENHLLLTSPSPTIFVLSSERAITKESAKEEAVLSVGNPRFDRRAYPALFDLPSSRREAETIAAYYNVSPLVETQATVGAVMGQLAKSDVIHFALHSVLDAEVPLRSKLLLTANPKNQADGSAESAFHAYDVYNLKELQARLVVLSACQTGAERYYGGEGMSSLARPFIAAGVPLVIASLWPVDSDSAAELMINFHKYRRHDGLPTVVALQKAQLDMLRAADGRWRRPYHWAPFTVIGGYATF